MATAVEAPVPPTPALDQREQQEEAARPQQHPSAHAAAEALPPPAAEQQQQRQSTEEGDAQPQPQQQQQQRQQESAAAKGGAEEAQQQTAGTTAAEDDPASAFECNICLELARDPVVTLCGHLYCWPCLFRWMQLQSVCRQCPVCKAGVDTDKVVPIYGRASDQPDPRSGDGKLDPLPARPAGQRSPAQPHPTQAPPPPNNQGVLPALFGFQLGPGQGYVEALTPEQQHQAFLSRLLLMLGSFVIMCLLLF